MLSSTFLPHRRFIARPVPINALRSQTSSLDRPMTDLAHLCLRQTQRANSEPGVLPRPLAFPAVDSLDLLFPPNPPEHSLQVHQRSARQEGYGCLHSSSYHLSSKST